MDVNFLTTEHFPSKWISMNLPNREELLFRVVLALPKASKMGLAFKILDSKAPPAEVPKLSHKYFKMYFVDSVFPAPLSPENKRKIKKLKKKKKKKSRKNRIHIASEASYVYIWS